MIFAEGKPRPGVIMQPDIIPTPADVLLCPFTSTILDAPIYRLEIVPDAANGLTARTQMMADKISPVRRDRIDRVIGSLSATDMGRLEGALAALLGLDN